MSAARTDRSQTSPFSTDGGKRPASAWASSTDEQPEGAASRMTEQAKAAWHRWREDTWVRPFLKQYRKALATSLALGVGALLFAAGLMFTAGYLISDAAEQPALGLFSLLVPLGLVQVFGIGKPFLSYYGRLRSHDWVFRIASALRRRLFERIAATGAFWNATRKTGEVLSLLADDVAHIQDLYVRCVLPLACAWIVWAVVIVLVGAFSVPFALFLLLGLGVLCLLTPLVSALANAGRTMRAKERSGRLYARLYDDIAGIADWNCAHRKRDYVDRVEREAARYDDERAAVRRSLARADLAAQLVFGALAVGVLAWAALQFGAMPQPAAATGAAGRAADWIAAFVIGFFPLLEAFAPASAAATGIGEHLDAIEHLNGLDDDQKANRTAGNARDAESEEHTEADRMANPSAVRLEGVSFCYPGTSRTALHDLNLAVEPGQRVAILGPSGCGKSTLLALIRGYQEPTAGRIMLDGTPVSAFGDKAPEHVSIVQQSAYLFNRSLYDNLALGDPSISRADAEKALEAVGLSELLQKLSAGIDTLVSESGLNFSGGEARRVALARVLLRDAPVVLLDEPTVSLDPPTERALLRTVFHALEGRTVIMATHHLAGIEQMDRVIFLDDGRVTLDGAPQHLERTSARYRHLLAFDRGQQA